MPIIRSSRVLYRWLLPVVFGALVFKLSIWCGAPNTTGINHLYNTLELLMMGINGAPKYVEQAIRSAIKIHLLHLVGILFPHICKCVSNLSLCHTVAVCGPLDCMPFFMRAEAL